MLPWVPRSAHRIAVSADDVLEALDRLSRGKAVGDDALRDNHLREALLGSVELRFRLAERFEAWLNSEEPLPAYMKEARTVMLSKDGTAYPPEGEVRVIAILPALTKLYEVFLHRELWRQVESVHPLHAL